MSLEIGGEIMSPFNKGETEKNRIQLMLFGGTDECRASDGAETGYLSQFASRSRERIKIFIFFCTTSS